jgi:hypothetical protein
MQSQLPTILFVSASLLSSTALITAMTLPFYSVGPFDINAIRVKGPVDLLIPNSKEKLISLSLAAVSVLIALSIMVNFIDKNIARVAHMITASVCAVLALASIVIMDEVISVPAAKTIKKLIPKVGIEADEGKIASYTILAGAFVLIAGGFFLKRRK